MPPKSKSDNPAAKAEPITNPVPETAKVPVVDVAAKLKEIADKNAASRVELEKYFGEKRWAAILKQAKVRNLTEENVTSLCGNMRRSRTDWDMVKGNDQAALILSANHLLIAIGSAPSKADEAALETALKGSAAA